METTASLRGVRLSAQKGPVEKMPDNWAATMKQSR